MFSGIWVAIAFFVGWLLHIGFYNPPLPYNQVSQSRKRLARAIFGGGAALLFTLALVHDSLLAPPVDWRNFENWLFKLHVVWSSFWVGLGWLIADNRIAIYSRIESLYNAFLGKDHESPWALQAALAILIIFGIILILKPSLLDRIQSVKAGPGQVEANFVNATSRIKESYARVNLNGVHARETISVWSKFAIFNEKVDINSLNSWEDIKDFGSSARLKIYAINKEPLEKAKAAHILFNGYIYPYVNALNCLKSIDELGFEQISNSEGVVSLAKTLRTTINNNYFDVDKTREIMNDAKSQTEKVWKEWSKIKPRIKSVSEAIPYQDCKKTQ